MQTKIGNCKTRGVFQQQELGSISTGKKEWSKITVKKVMMAF